MDTIYLWMIGLFVVVLVLDYLDKRQNNQENFENIGGFNPGQPYVQERNLVTYSRPEYSANVNFNFRKNNLNFRNFGTDGVNPPYLKCPMCSIQFDCSSYPYEISDKNENVCTTCMGKYVLNDKRFPVFARANGRPRVCRNLE